MDRRRSLRVWIALAAAGWVVGFGSAVHAQFPVSSGPPISMVEPGLSSTPAVVAAPVIREPIVEAPAPSAATNRIRYALPLFSQARRESRTANRYTVARPVYAGRPGVTFAPYSDYYFPRVIGAKETVYTGTPSSPAPVGYRGYAQPGASKPLPSIFNR